MSQSTQITKNGDLSIERPISKPITWEQFLEWHNLPSAGRIVTRYQYGDSDSSNFSHGQSFMNPAESIKDNNFWIGFYTNQIETEKNYKEYLAAWLVKYLEEDEDSRIFLSTGKLHTSYDYDEQKKETTKLSYNTQDRIRTRQLKIEQKVKSNAELEKLLVMFDELEATE